MTTYARRAAAFWTAIAAAEAAAALHCCQAPSDAPIALVCDGSSVASVDFASYGNESQGLFFCGAEEAQECGIRIEDDLEAQCVGKAFCRPNLTHIPDPCPGAQSRLMVRWSCSSPAQRGSEPARHLPDLPLRVENGRIVDARGQRFTLNGVNWAGFHIEGAASGLDRAPLESIAALIRRLGFNVVRLPWSVEMVLTNPVVDERWVAANPRLQGLRALSVYDEVVKALADAGVLVWSDNHISDSDWCCDDCDCNGVWFNERFSEEQWVEAHRLIAKRFSHVPSVVGVGLRNEPRSVCGGKSHGIGDVCNSSFYDPGLPFRGCAEVSWASGPGPEALRWRSASERAGRAVLAEKPSILVSISGIDYAQDLTHVKAEPARLPQSNLVYEAHEYIWFKYSTHPGMALTGARPEGGMIFPNKKVAENNCTALGDACVGLTCELDRSNCTLSKSSEMMPSVTGKVSFMKKYNLTTFEGFFSSLDYWWGNLVRDRVAPIFVTEFGMGHDFDSHADVRLWFSAWAKYIGSEGPMSGEAGGLDWSYWELSGEQMGGTGRTYGATEGFGILNHCWNAPANDQHLAAVQSLMLRPPTKRGSPVPEFVDAAELHGGPPLVAAGSGSRGGEAVAAAAALTLLLFTFFAVGRVKGLWAKNCTRFWGGATYTLLE